MPDAQSVFQETVPVHGIEGSCLPAMYKVPGLVRTDSIIPRVCGFIDHEFSGQAVNLLVEALEEGSHEGVPLSG
jgi:hypothetical protein